MERDSFCLFLLPARNRRRFARHFVLAVMRRTAVTWNPAGGGRPEWHIQCDVLTVLDTPTEFSTMDGVIHFVHGWDMILAFPPCTDLAVSGARWFKEKQADGRQQRSVEFFMQFANADCPRVAIENPVGIMSTLWRKPDQIIQPWQFGHGETKATCLWLKGLPPLTPTDVVDGREQRVWRMPPSADRAKLRSRTYHGIAEAMASQWGSVEI